MLAQGSLGPAPNLVPVIQRSQPQAWADALPSVGTPTAEAAPGLGWQRDTSITWSPQSPAWR